ncbi:MAG: ROK family protein [Anaerorhabdus sp.]|uniref:ROK family protein n=1 Tax=Anaerorhabdus sp. TaxID=1872524 RepID=UPI003A86CFC8
MKNYLGIDIGGTSVKMGIVNEEGTVLLQHESSVSFDNYQTPIIETVVKTVHQFNASHHYIIEGIAISAAGQIDTKLGKVIGTCGNLPNYIGSEFKSRFEKEFNYNVTVVNDANCMILGEKWIGNAKNHENVIGITLGTGVGGGILVNNQILLGSRGLAGEIGHFIVDKAGLLCTCGNNGCYEQVASTTALIRRVKNSCNAHVNVDGRWIFNEVQNGNAQVIQCVNEWIDDIAIGLVSLIHIFNPSCILIGGGVSSQEEFLINPLREKVFSLVMPRFKDNLELKQARLKNNAGIIGAVYYYIYNN